MDLGTENSMTIYVKLIDEPVDVWRPVSVIEVGPGLFRILAKDDYDPELEEWEFPPGSLVAIRKEQLSMGKVYVATSPK